MANNIRTSPKGAVRTLSNLRPTFEKVRKDGASNVIIEQRLRGGGDLTVGVSRRNRGSTRVRLLVSFDSGDENKPWDARRASNGDISHRTPSER